MANHHTTLTTASPPPCTRRIDSPRVQPTWRVTWQQRFVSLQLRLAAIYCVYDASSFTID